MSIISDSPQLAQKPDDEAARQAERTAEAERLFHLMRPMPKTAMGMARQLGQLKALLDSLLIGAAVNESVSFEEIAQRVEAHAAKVRTLDGAA